MDHATSRDPRLLGLLAERLDGGNEPDTLPAREVARYCGLLARELGSVQPGAPEASVVEVAVCGARHVRRGGTPFGSLAAAAGAEVPGRRGGAGGAGDAAGRRLAPRAGR